MLKEAVTEQAEENNKVIPEMASTSAGENTINVTECFGNYMLQKGPKPLEGAFVVLVQLLVCLFLFSETIGIPAHRASREAASHTLGLKLQTAMLFTGGTPGLLLWHDLLLTGIA